MKRILALLIVAAIALFSAGCGDSNSQTTTDSQSESEQEVSADADSEGASPEGLPESRELSSDAQQRADDAYAFIASLSDAASAYDSNAARYNYTLNCHDPANSAAGEFLYAWSDAVLAATKGDVYIEIGVSNAFSSGGTMTTLDDMKNGMIDFDWTLPCYFNLSFRKMR